MEDRDTIIQELADIKPLLERADNATIVLLLTTLIEERRRTNKLLEEILQLLKQEKGENVEDLAEQDEKILELIRERGYVTAEDVKEALGYRGLNGASARLNNLHKRGILRKIRKGKKVYFTLS